MLFKVVKSRLRNGNVEGRGVGETKCGSLESGERSWRTRKREGSVKISDDSELLSRETSILSNVNMIYNGRTKPAEGNNFRNYCGK
jgi:hypothetical protein